MMKVLNWDLIMVRWLAQYLEIQWLYGNLEALLLGGSLLFTSGKVIGSDEGINMGSTDGKVISTILEYLDGIIIGLDIGTELGYLYGSFDGSNDGNIEGLFLGGSLGFTISKVLGSDEGIKLGLSYG